MGGRAHLSTERDPRPWITPRRAAVTAGQQPEQLARENGVLLLGARRVKPARADVERSGKVEFLVLAGRRDAALLTAQHPVATHLRVEMDVDLVGAQHRFVRRRALLETSDLRQNAQPFVARPGAKQVRRLLVHAGEG